ncbi:DinB family protein [Paenibacillus jilunlii]|uniref:Damage-inducible protein DinB n=1 Tax=Paenibacillus jilunlii TaxID=682956 RepID=A0A1G9HAL9_9BACL|nr:DinB family protein [Paenibacillus jilunlii]KWX77455.1 damage-inducible protein DinB [Paenibacillus jilunlii]SDL09814.1 Uncharacterized damage-inducible protein DinB (forms a four-helix bundle) [Paenibacillus jilunlii]
MKQYIMQQFEYHVWANRKVCGYLQELTEEVYQKNIVSVFPTIYDAMVHIYVIDHGWLSFFRAGGVTDMSAEYLSQLKDNIDSLVAATKGKRIEELWQMMDNLAEQFRIFIRELEDIEVIYPSGAFQGRCLDYIQHMVNHGTYHRGNVTAMLRQMGHPGTPTDYGFYLYTLSQ